MVNCKHCGNSFGDFICPLCENWNDLGYNCDKCVHMRIIVGRYVPDADEDYICNYRRRSNA